MLAADAPHSLERPNTSVLRLMGLQLVPLAEVLSAALKVTLESSHNKTAANMSTEDNEKRRT